MMYLPPNIVLHITQRSKISILSYLRSTEVAHVCSWSCTYTVCFLHTYKTFSLTTVEPVLKDHPNGHKNVVCQDRWSLVTGSVILKCRSFCQKCVICQDRWSLMAVVSQDRFHCIIVCWKLQVKEGSVIVLTTEYSDNFTLNTGIYICTLS